MYAIDEEMSGREAVTLKVADPVRSHEFYQDLFGLVLHEESPASGRRLMESPGCQSDLAIILRQRAVDEPSPMWLSVEVASVSEVLDTYLLAILMGAKALLPRKRGARWNTVITDPDGNQISVWTRVDDEAVAAPAMRPQRWQWRLSSDRTDDVDVAIDKRGLRSSVEDGADSLPGRCAAGADRVDRRCSSVGGNRAVPAGDRGRTLEGKE
jgi:catechol 2,3-dioxygenase-like lactoylglutathione lyase family enzyme